jgi:F-type H+-transporting ATPase subunit b
MIDLDQPLMLLLNATPLDRVFGLDSRTLTEIVLQMVSVGFLAFILTKVMYKPVLEFMQKRTERIQSQFHRARDEMDKAEALTAEYERKLMAIHKERDAILDEARKAAAETSRQTIAEAKADAEATKARAHANIELEKERVQAEMRLAIIEVSAAMTAKFMARAMDKAVHDKLFDETMSELEDVVWRS